MKCIIVLFAMSVLMVCVLFSRLYKPYRGKDQTLRNNGRDTTTGNNITIIFYGSIDPTGVRDPSLCTKC